MTEERWNAVDHYICDLFVPPDAALDAALRAADEAALPAIQVAPNQGKLLMILARSLGVRKILELGTLAGYSTIWLARALQPGGTVLTLEANAKHAEVARLNVARAGLAAQVKVRLGAALETLPQLAAEGYGPFDLVFIDADKPNYAAYLEWAITLSRPGSLIIADNVVREGNVVDTDSDDESAQGARRFNAALAADKRVSATVIQTVGSKGYDGLSFAVVL
ncbi:MAG: O-methyltransferase [Herpetosiphon sp.]